MCAGALGGRAITYDAPLLCCCSSVGGEARRVHGGLSTGRVAAAPAGLRDPSGLHVHLYVWEIVGNSGVGRCSLGMAYRASLVGLLL